MSSLIEAGFSLGVFCCSVLVWLKYMNKIQPYTDTDGKGSILTASSAMKCEYSSLILHQNSTSHSFLKVILSIESETIAIIFSCSVILPVDLFHALDGSLTHA